MIVVSAFNEYRTISFTFASMGQLAVKDFLLLFPSRQFLFCLLLILLVVF